MSGVRLARRDLVLMLSAVCLAGWPGGARAQQVRFSVIGFLGAASAEAWVLYVAAFRKGLEDLGYVEGKNIVIEFRWADGRYERLPALAADLVRREVAVLVSTGGTASVRAAVAATKTIPIVFTLGADPVEQGFVSNLSRPGGNATGVTMFTAHLPPKRLEMLHEIGPRAAKIAILVNPGNPATPLFLRRLEGTAQALYREIFVLSASTERDIGVAFEALAQRRAGGLVISTDPLFDGARTQIARLIVRYAIPTIQGWREDAEAGGLMSYGADLRESYHLAGVYTARVLKGARPGELPIQQSSKVELIINLRTAKTLGITIPPALLARADEVIE
jgi:putative ABC transport system substrate-binding protein